MSGRSRTATSAVATARSRGILLTGGGVALIVASFAQLLVPGRVLAPPTGRVLGLPVVPVGILGLGTTLLALGVVLAGEGICMRLGAPSLWRLVVADPRLPLCLVAAGALAGIAMEIVAQWLGKLWVYPYWTSWFYVLALVPGFAFYWLAIVESYLAVKAVLDALAGRRSRSGARGPWPAAILGAAGTVCLLASALLFIQWYAVHGGFTFAITTASAAAPPFGYAVLALIGLVLAAHWVLHRQRRASPLDTVRDGYWIPLAAVIGASVLASLVMEAQNAVHDHWLYTHFPAPEVGLGGVPLSVMVTWPLQYPVFLLIPSLIHPEFATLFWRDPRPPARPDPA